MFDLGGPGENIAPDEGGGGSGSEQLSEEARARFTAAAAGAAQARKEERTAKKRDDGVAQMILQFLTDAQRTHLAVLISRLVSLDCPSPFLLAILSLVNRECDRAVQEYLAEHDATASINHQSLTPRSGAALSAEANAELESWILSMELVLATDPRRILSSLIVDEGNIDGTVLQLTTFVLEEFLKTHNQSPVFDDLQRVTISILQSVFESYIHMADVPDVPVIDE